MMDREMRRVMAGVGTWMVRHRDLCADLKCLCGLMAARLRYAALCHRALAESLIAVARKVEAEARGINLSASREPGAGPR